MKGRLTAGPFHLRPFARPAYGPTAIVFALISGRTADANLGTIIY
jgi:hypothetical protein